MVTADSDGPVEVCVPVRHPPRDPAELAWRVEPAHREAFISVTRTHFEIPAIWSIYDRLARWAAAPGRRRAGAPREVYRPEAEPLFAPAGQQICDGSRGWGCESLGCHPAHEFTSHSFSNWAG
jgi:hypothetical protein